MTVTPQEVKLIVDSVKQLRDVVTKGFAKAEKERKEMAHDIKVLSNWKIAQESRQNTLKENERASSKWRSAFLVLLGILATLVATYLTNT